ncbi:hypothetical protein B0H63DRAFT_180746 [Podospora didyma]|uniref:Uncharacterized protein n=1 Tax=Podospora didyma TaxID=330526 RepID=A0AAE0TZG5_9PEZI|nr:hypothetical protein B0H63DRAFT_180746 [Podospora didyma]
MQSLTPENARMPALTSAGSASLDETTPTAMPRNVDSISHPLQKLPFDGLFFHPDFISAFFWTLCNVVVLAGLVTWLKRVVWLVRPGRRGRHTTENEETLKPDINQLWETGENGVTETVRIRHPSLTWQRVCHRPPSFTRLRWKPLSPGYHQDWRGAYRVSFHEHSYRSLILIPFFDPLRRRHMNQNIFGSRPYTGRQGEQRGDDAEPQPPLQLRALHLNSGCRPLQHVMSLNRTHVWDRAPDFRPP